jgi:hypothetical protein
VTPHPENYNYNFQSEARAATQLPHFVVSSTGAVQSVGLSNDRLTVSIDIKINISKF